MTSSQAIRGFSGPLLFSHGFRAFFLFSGLWAGLAMILWIFYLAMGLDIPSAMAGVDWHMHEMVFGYASGVIAGFLLTAVPNWTGRMPITGWPTAALVGLWVLGRIVIFFSLYLPFWAPLVVEGSFLPLFGAVIGREIIGGQNRKNLKILLIIALLAAANIWFHVQSLNGDAYEGTAIRSGVALIVMLISVIGGRVVPSFTRNWLARQGRHPLPVPFNGFDRLTLALSALSLAGWLIFPDALVAHLALVFCGLLHLMRLGRWQGVQTLREPMVWVLHAGYVFVPLGFLMAGLQAYLPDYLSPAAIPHAWTSGAIGTMTIAMMTRASLGHTGRPVTATPPILFVYLSVIGATLLRMGAEFFPASTGLLHGAGTLWILAFGLFVMIYLPILTRPRLPRHA